jgi:riboflavin-specific deaminase-like protein
LSISARSPTPGKVVVNMAVSVDGRITTRTREHVALGSERDRRLMDELRTRADAVIIGAGTIRHHGHPIVIRYDDLRKRRVARGRAPHPVNVVLSRALDLPLRARFFASTNTRRIVFTTKRAPKARVRAFEKVAEVVVLPGTSLSPRLVMRGLARRGLRRVLLEGGGEVHFAFAKAGLVGEIYVTVTPRLIGGKQAPSFLDGEGFLWKQHLRLRLVSARRIGEEVFLRYRVLGPTTRPTPRARGRRP